MNPESDLRFAGACEVIVVDGRGDFVGHGGDDPTWLAGRYADDVPPQSVRVGEAASLFGQFVLLRHEPLRRRLVVATDRFGLYPLYVASGQGRRAGTLWLSTDLWSLRRALGAGTEVDPEAMSDIVAFNVPFERRTLTPGITTAAGGTRLEIDLDTLSIDEHRDWQPEVLLAQGYLKFDDVKDRLVDLFLEGLELATRSQPQVAVTLSGGADSRCLLAGSLSARRQTVVYSTGVPGSRALAYAHGMAQRCGVPCHAHPLDHAFLARFPELMADSGHTMQGMSFSSELEAMWLRQHVVPEGVLLHGAFAELFKIGKMHNYHYDDAVAGLDGDALADHLWRRFSARYALRRGGLASKDVARMGDASREHLFAKVARHRRGLDNAGVLQMIYIEEFLGKVARASWQMWRRRIPVHFPFAYPPLVDLMLRVRTSDKVANHFVMHLLRRTNPVLARYPDSNTGVPIGSSRLRRQLMHVADVAIKRLFRPKARSDHQDFASWLSHAEPPLEAVFSRLQTEAGGYDMPHLHALTERCRAGDDNAARALHFLWAWGLWKREQSAPSTGS